MIKNKARIITLISILQKNYPLIKRSKNMSVYGSVNLDSLHSKLDSFSFYLSQLEGIKLRNIQISPPNHLSKSEQLPGIILNLEVEPEIKCYCNISHSIYYNRIYFLSHTIESQEGRLAKDSLIHRGLHYVIQISPKII